MMQDIECVFQSMTGRGSIFISNLAAAQNVSLLHSKGIKAILSATRTGLLKHKKQQIPHYLYIPAQDHEGYDLSQHFGQTYDFIEKARTQTNVLVHCIAGVSRSVTIVIAYLLKRYKYKLEQILSMIHRKRRKINPNPGFMEQLKKYAESQGIKCEMRGNYLQALRGNSMSRGKRVQVSKEKVRKAFTSQFKVKETQENISKDASPIPKQKVEPLPRYQSHLQMKKIVSYDEKKQLNVENQESTVQIKVKEKVPERITDRRTERVTERATERVVERERPVIEQMKKSVSASQKERRGLSIEEKIKRIRDKVLKNDKVGMEGYRNSAFYSPIYKKSPKKLENSSLEKQNRGIKKEEQQFSPKQPLQMMSPNNENSLFKTFQNTAATDSRWISTPLKLDEPEKQLFSELNPDTPSLYSPMRMHKRASSKLTYQNRP